MFGEQMNEPHREEQGEEGEMCEHALARTDGHGVRGAGSRWVSAMPIPAQSHWISSHGALE